MTKSSNYRGWGRYVDERRCSGISGCITNGARQDHRGWIFLLIFSLNFNTLYSFWSPFFTTALSPNSFLNFHVSSLSSQFICLHLLSAHPLTTAFLPLPQHIRIAKPPHCFLVKTSKLPTTTVLLSSHSSLFAMFPYGPPNSKPSCSASTSLVHLHIYLLPSCLSTFPRKKIISSTTFMWFQFLYSGTKSTVFLPVPRSNTSQEI